MGVWGKDKGKNGYQDQNINIKLQNISREKRYDNMKKPCEKFIHYSHKLCIKKKRILEENCSQILKGIHCFVEVEEIFF